MGREDPTRTIHLGRIRAFNPYRQTRRTSSFVNSRIRVNTRRRRPTPRQTSNPTNPPLLQIPRRPLLPRLNKCPNPHHSPPSPNRIHNRLHTKHFNNIKPKLNPSRLQIRLRSLTHLNSPNNTQPPRTSLRRKTRRRIQRLRNGHVQPPLAKPSPKHRRPKCTGLYDSGVQYHRTDKVRAKRE